MKPHSSSSQSGSAIVFIFIGIVLFAALSFAVSQSLRIGGGTKANMTAEKMDLYMVELTQFLEAVRTRANTMIEVEGVQELLLSFKNDIYLRADGGVMCHNENSSCTDPSCMVYSPENPEGIVPVIFDKIASPIAQITPGQSRNGTVLIAQLAVDGVGSAAQELVLQVNGVSPEFCNHYNSKLGLTTNFTEASTFADIGENALNSVGTTWGGCGAPAAFDGTDTFGDQATMFRGMKTFCGPRKLPAFTTGRLGIIYVVRAH